MKSYITLLLATVTSISTMAQTYDISEPIINSSHLRSTYYTKSSFIDFGISFEEFIKTVDKTKPTVIHSHGCSGVLGDDTLLKNFYTGLGFNFVMLNFHNRGDASASCSSSGGFSYHADPYTRLPPRLLELVNHINVLKANGITTIYATGHSEGGMVVQLLQDEVAKAIIHSMSCIPLPKEDRNAKIKYLHLVSKNDPLLTRPGIKTRCDSRTNYITDLSSVRSHGALADPSWEPKIKEFLAVK